MRKIVQFLGTVYVFIFQTIGGGESFCAGGGRETRGGKTAAGRKGGEKT